MRHSMLQRPMHAVQLVGSSGAPGGESGSGGRASGLLMPLLRCNAAAQSLKDSCAPAAGVGGSTAPPAARCAPGVPSPGGVIAASQRRAEQGVAPEGCRPSSASRAPDGEALRSEPVASESHRSRRLRVTSTTDARSTCEPDALRQQNLAHQHHRFSNRTGRQPSWPAATQAAAADARLSNLQG